MARLAHPPPRPAMTPESARPATTLWTSADASGLSERAPQSGWFGPNQGVSLTQAAGAGFEPTSDLNGHCRYSRSASSPVCRHVDH
jgi:hypothetical protein